MITKTLSLVKDLADAIQDDVEKKRAALPFLRELQETVQETVHETVKETVHEAVQSFASRKIPMPFLHNMAPDIQSEWSLADFRPDSPNDEPNLNLSVMGLILATNIESTVGDHAWSLVEYSLDRLGFTDMVHRYFEEDHKVNYPAMVFGRSIETVGGKTVVAAVYRGSSSFEDFISDAKAEPGGFEQAGINATNELRAYCEARNLTKENTILFITGHSYGASCTSLVGISSTDLAERDCIFCYSYATPNYTRKGLTGEGMKMFSFNSNEDVVPQVPVGPALDKTGKVIWFDRQDLELRHPEKYSRFMKLYKHFRDNDYDTDTDFLPDAYTFKPYVPLPVSNTIIRNHMPYTYMPFILADLPDEVVDSYIVNVPRPDTGKPDWSMFVGEAYKLPLTKTGLFTWKTSDEAVASVDERGLLTGKAPGETFLTITAPGGKESIFRVRVTDD